MLMLPGQFSELGQYKTSYWLPDTDRIATMMAQHFNVSLLDSEQAIERGHVAIQDSTSSDRAVQALVNTLQKFGYRNGCCL